VARERRIDLAIVEGSMDDLGMLPAGRFDLVVHPVSTCYLPDVAVVFREVARVTKPGGLYISQHKSPASLQAGLVPNERGRYEFEHPQGTGEALPDAPPSRLREAGCRAGFAIEDVAEPDHARPAATHGGNAHRAVYLPPYLRVLARRGGPRSATGLVVVHSFRS
jgi:SAM-dependent methyltransferase